MSRRLRARTLVGRADEVAGFDRLAAEAAGGRGACAVLLGEAGVGKSRLMSEVTGRAAAAGMTVLAGRAVEGGGAYRPLADALLALHRVGRMPPPGAVEPFAGALATIVPGWSTGPEGQVIVDRSLLVSEGLLRLLRVVGQEGGALLALDDLHWADADTLAVLDRLSDAVDGAPVLALLAARPDGSAALQRLAGRAGHEVRLERLSVGHAADMVTACAGDVPLPAHVRKHVLERAEGLPFLLEELLTGLVDSGALRHGDAGWEAPTRIADTVPASFAAVVHQRLSTLVPRERDVVQAAAVLGRQVDWRLLAHVTGQPDNAVLDALRAALDRGLLVTDSQCSDVFRFVHALTREAVLDRLLPPQRLLLARRAAQLVEEAGTDPLLAATLHEQAGNVAAAARLLVAAADRAGDALVSREQLLRRAAALQPGDADVSVALVHVLALTGKATEARETGDPLLLRLVEGDPRRSPLALTLARACLVAAQLDDAVRYLAVAGDGPAVRALAAHVAFARQRPQEADLLARAVVDAEDPAVRCEALELVGRVARLNDRRDAAEEAFSQALAVAERHALRLWEVRALHELGTLDMLGPARSDRLEAARELAVQTGVLVTAAVLDLQIASVHSLTTDHASAMLAARRCVELAESLRLPVLAGAGMVFVAMAQGLTGQVAEMETTLDEAERRLQHDPDMLAAARFARGNPAMLAHDLPTWREWLHDGMAVLRRNPSASPTPLRGQHALLETVLGDGSAEREDLRRCGATVQASNCGALLYADAVATARAGDDPSTLLGRAEAVMAPLPWRRHHMRLVVAPAAVRDGWGQPVPWLREAAEFFAASGDEGLARACREHLRAAGAPVPRRGNGGSLVPPHLHRLGVTPREMDVLRLVVEGLSNAAVAERLVLSRRTVETHVARLLDKTGARGRADLRAHLHPASRDADTSVLGVR